ncbi:MAG: alpha/beta fold hydrolase [Patescibacteria group bacterium]
MKDVAFKVGNNQLKGSLFYPSPLKDKNPAVLFIHGWTSAQDRYSDQAKNLNDLGVICLTFDLRGHGISDGNINAQSRQNFLDDTLCAYDFLVSDKNVDPNSITIIGSSFGAYLALLLTRHREVKRLILRVPANYLNSNFNEPQIKYSDKLETLKWRYEVKNPQDTFALAALHNFEGDVLIIESGEDKIISHQTIQNYLDAVKDQSKLDHIVMKGAPHSLSGYPEFKKQFQQITYNWLEAKLND